MGSKPKAPSAPSKPKPEVEEAIEVEAKPVTKKPTMKEIIDSNQSIRLAVDELQAQEVTVDRPHIQDKLLDLMDMGKITTDDYKEAKKLLE
jgi:hypothetical protein